MAKHITREARDRILRNSDLDAITGISRTTRWRMEQNGQFPKRRQISYGAVGWASSEVETWMQERGFGVGRMIGRNKGKGEATITEAV